jgi:hypothetical protein
LLWKFRIRVGGSKIESLAKFGATGLIDARLGKVDYRETVKTVDVASVRSATPLKRGVNEKALRFLNRFCTDPG